MARSKWKLKYLASYLMKKNYKQFFKNKIWSRNSVIPFYLENKNVLVHNGKIFKKIFITRERIGYKFGEFVFTKVVPKNIKIKKNIKKTK